MGKMPLLLPPDGAKQRRSPGRRRPWARGPRGMVAAGNRGKKGRATPGFDSPPQFQRRGPTGRSAAAMAVAGRRRPWAAR